jgi:UDP-N-acetyl-D-mannosaminuronic acid dehydrogenase
MKSIGGALRREELNPNQFHRISVVGLGYIGLPTATLFANAGLDVMGIDVSARIIDAVNSGHPHFGEPNLDVLLTKVVSAGKLRASLKAEPAEAFIIAVPTPFRDGHQPDLSCVEAAVRAIAPVLEKGNLVILESTSPVGATEQVAEWLGEGRPDLVFPRDGEDAPDVNVAYCPERVLPGRILDELISNARIIGGLTPACGARARALYESIVLDEKCHVTTARAAEMAKLSENSFRDVNIAFANELSIICDKLGIDAWEVIRLANLHPRVKILEPGPGVGGHCIAVDPWFIVSKSPDEARLIRTAREVNDSKPHHVVAKVRREIASGCLLRPTIACFGMSYKADVDDLRESPSIEIVESLARNDLGRVLAVEPNIVALPPALAALGVQLADRDEAIAQADVLVMLVDHREFRSVDRSRLAGKIVIDTRGIW